MRLENRVALVTGAGRGIGRAIALAYAQEGARLVLTARTASELEETSRLCQELGASTHVVLGDVTVQEDVEQMVSQTVDRFSAVDILVNNAGIGGPVGAAQDNDIAEWIRTIQVNVVGVYLCCRAALPVMRRQGRGKIVNLAGAGAASAWANLSAYCASKAAVIRLTETLSLELEGTNVQVNALGPGSINTRMWEELRDGAKDVGDTGLYELGQRVTSGGGASIERAAELAVFLASDASGEMTGRLISAVTDDFHNLPPRIPEIMASDAFTVRRVELD
ncbi:MAG: SDR family oxidoreductase [Chloroflexi bacterium]|nr:SDR family oxidoreductase [Chloroflexota bacterium]